MRSITITRLFLCITLFPCSVSKAETVTKQDLLNTYNGQTNQLHDLQNELNSAPASIKSQWYPLVADGLQKINNLYTNTLQSIKPYETQLSSKDFRERLYATGKISSLIEAAQSSINTIATNLIIKVKSLLSSYQQADYQKKMEAVVAQLRQIIIPFDKVLLDQQQFAKEAYKKPYNVKKIEALIQEWQAVTAKAYAVYKQLGPITSIDRSNLLVASINNISDFLIGILFDQLYTLHDQKQDDAYYKALSDISKKLLGTQNSKDSFLVAQGYDGVVKSEIAKYFSDQTARTKMLNYYTQKKINLTYDLYTSALQALASNQTNPIDAQRAYALDMYTLVLAEANLFSSDESRVIARKQQINTSMGLIYFNSASSLIQSLQINQDTKPLVLRIIDFYKKAADYSSQGNPEVQGQAPTYKNFSEKLSQALDAQAQADGLRKTDQKNAIALYKKAQQLFLEGGDGVDSNKVAISSVDLEGDYATKTVKNSFNQFFTTHKDTIQKYFTYISTMQNTLSITEFSEFFLSLITVYQDAYDSYNQALISYNGVLEKNPALKQTSQLQQAVQNFTAATSVVATLKQAQDELHKGDRLSGAKTTQALRDAVTNNYTHALVLFQKADTMYANNTEMVILVPRYFDSIGIKSDFTTVANQHIASVDSELASSVADVSIELAYYMDAYNHAAYLSDAVKNFLMSKLAELSKSGNAVDTSFAAAQTAEKSLLNLPPSAWVSTNDAVYSSEASVKWKSLVQQYISIYHLGKLEAKAAAANAIAEYAAHYKKNVPESFSPEIGLAFIAYWHYILSISDNEQQEAMAVLKEINEYVTTFFTHAEQLLTSVASSASLLTTASINQQKLLEWDQRFNEALHQQQEVIATVGGSKERSDNVQLLEKSTKQDTITYMAVQTKKEFTMQDPLLKLADLYKQIADAYFDKKEYKDAYFAYKSAVQKYTQANRSESSANFEKRLALANTLYLATEYRDLVVPQGKITISNFEFPRSYQLQVYGQAVPEVLSNQFSNLDFLKTDKQKATAFLVGLATNIYVYNKISDLFGTDQFDTYYPLLTLSFDQLKSNPLFQALSDNKKIAFVTLAANAGKLNKTLQDRLAQQKSNLVLQQQANKQFILFEYGIDVPRFMDLVNYYQSYPTVIKYYTVSANLFKPGPADEMITIGNSSLPHGNDQNAYDAMLAAQFDTYLSQGYSYQQQFEEIKKDSSWIKLKNVQKNDMAVSLDDYMPLKDTIEGFLQNMVGYYYGPLSNKLITHDDARFKSLNNVLAQSYIQWGEALKTFLVGDPLSMSYTAILKEILGKYVVAIVTFNAQTTLYADLAQLYTQAGNILVSQDKHFTARSFFYTAAVLLQRITPQSSATIKLVDDAYMNYFGAMFKGSNRKMGEFQKARIEPIEITLSDGTREKISFNDLLAKYLAYRSGSAQSLDPSELTEMQTTLKGLILDALIFYVSCDALITQGIPDHNVPAILDTLVPTNDMLHTASTEASKLIHAFTERNTISFDTIDSATLMMSRTDFPDGKNFVEMLDAAFDMCRKKVEQSSDVVNRAVGYSAIAQLSLKLREAFGYLYKFLFYGITATTATENPDAAVAAEEGLSAEIRAETNAIISPPDQYIGQ